MYSSIHFGNEWAGRMSAGIVICESGCGQSGVDDASKVARIRNVVETNGQS